MIDPDLIAWIATVEARYKQITVALQALADADAQLAVGIRDLSSPHGGATIGPAVSTSLDTDAFNAVLDGLAKLGRQVDDLSVRVDEIAVKIEAMQDDDDPDQ